MDEQARLEAAKAAFLQGLDLLEEDRPAEAEACFAQSLRDAPARPSTLVNLSIAQLRQGKLAGARESAEQALDHAPGHPAALNQLAATLNRLGLFEEARALAQSCVAADADAPEAHYNLGHALGGLGLWGEALASLEAALSLDPGFAEAWVGKGNALRQVARHEEALDAYQRALALQPRLADAWLGAGDACARLKRNDEAFAAYARALELAPGMAQAWLGRGDLLIEAKRFDEALAAYDAALALAPKSEDGWNRRGNALGLLRRLDEALAAYETARAIAPDLEFLAGSCLRVKMRICDWTDLAADMADCAARIEAGAPAIHPFVLLGLTDSPKLQLQAARIYAQARYRADDSLGPCPTPAHEGRIRIGYFSADFHDHATAFLMAELFEVHDRQRFEIHAFSYGPDRDDAMRRRLVAAFNSFTDVSAMSDREAARVSRGMGIDIAVDLKGYTQDERTGLFAHRCAPAQAAYIGFPGTMGADFIDYIIADRVVVPPGAEGFYAEKIVRLPGAYQVNDGQRRISPQEVTRAQAGLPERGFVFCSFNSSFKITPETFDGWMRILHAVEDSVLWLYRENPFMADNLRREAQARGIAGERLVFAPPLPPDEHLARHRLADLFLDTFPCNAHTTTSDSLWAGLPVLTRPGRAFASRVAASLLENVGLPDLIAPDADAYEALAIALARDPARLAEIRRRLDANRRNAPLFDARLFARRLEAAYEAMRRRSRAGLAPDHIDIPA